MEFPVRVVGSRPKAKVTIDEPPPPPAVVSASPQSEIEGTAQPAPAAATVDLKPHDYVITFGQLLVGKRDTKTFTISNTGLLPIKWRLAGADSLPAELQCVPSAGELAARSEVKVSDTVEKNESKLPEKHGQGLMRWFAALLSTNKCHGGAALLKRHSLVPMLMIGIA